MMRRQARLTADELARAIAGGQALVTRYQPKVRLADRVPVGVETLARLRHPRLGLVGPEQFVPLAESAGLAPMLTAAVTRQAVADVTKGAERALEAETRAKVDGKLWRAWKSDIYPEAGQLAKNPAGEISLNGGARTKGAMTAYARGATIRGRQGQYLAIPLPAAGVRQTGRGKNSLTPAEWERRTGRRLRLIYRRTEPSLLVADDVVLGKNGRGVRQASKRRIAQGREVLTVPIFILVPEVTIGKRFSIENTLKPFEERLARELNLRLTRAITENERS